MEGEFVRGGQSRSENGRWVCKWQIKSEERMGRENFPEKDF
jgi:hypothetical protein